MGPFSRRAVLCWASDCALDSAEGPVSVSAGPAGLGRRSPLGALVCCDGVVKQPQDAHWLLALPGWLRVRCQLFAVLVGC